MDKKQLVYKMMENHSMQIITDDILLDKCDDDEMKDCLINELVGYGKFVILRELTNEKDTKSIIVDKPTLENCVQAMILANISWYTHEYNVSSPDEIFDEKMYELLCNEQLEYEEECDPRENNICLKTHENSEPHNMYCYEFTGLTPIQELRVLMEFLNFKIEALIDIPKNNSLIRFMDSSISNIFFEGNQKDREKIVAELKSCFLEKIKSKL